MGIFKHFFIGLHSRWYWLLSSANELLQTALAKAIRKAKRDYNLDVRIGSAKFTGLSSVAFTNISVVPEERDSLARIQRVEVAVRFWPLADGQNRAVGNDP